MASMRVFLLILTLSFFAPAFADDDPLGAEIYQKHCASCHDQGGATRIPPFSALQQMTAAAVNRALEFGAMKTQGSALSRGERQTLSAWVGRARATTSINSALPNKCPASSFIATANTPSWTNWGLGLSNLRFQNAPGFTVADVPKLKLKWAFGLPDIATVRSQPAVYAGRLFLASQDTVYSLDAKTGCVYWAVNAAASVRTGIVVAKIGDRAIILFGDIAAQVNALDAATGESVWQLHADEHPAAQVTATPVFYEGRLYVAVSSYEETRGMSPSYLCCDFRGSLQALDAASGKTLWKTYTISETPKPGANTKQGAKTVGPSGAGIWSSPTLDPAHNRIYVTTGDNYSDPTTATSDAVLALALDSGKLLWSKQFTTSDAYNSACAVSDKVGCPDSDGPDHDFGAPAMLVPLTGGRRVLILSQKSGMMHAVDPDHEGKIVWESKVGDGGILGGLQWGPASDGRMIYAALSDIRFTRERVAGTNNTVSRLDPMHGGGMFAFRADNGERMWMTPPPGCGDRRPCSPAQSAAVTAINGAAFSGSVDGHLRAYATTNGKIVWDFDTAREFTTINGVPAKGGSMDAGGVVIAGGMLYVGSGYGQWGGMPGNVLLAFGLE